MPVTPLFAVLVSQLVNRWRRRRRMRKLAPANMVVCALRVVDGYVPYLDDRWRHTEAALERGRLRFQAMPEIDVEILVHRISAQPPRRPRLRELARDMDTGYRIHQIETDDATLEWRVPASWQDWATSALRQPRPTPTS